MITDPVRELLDAEEQDILQEIMNIGFGNAAADLASVIDIYVQLTVPSVKIIPATEFPDYIRKEIGDNREISFVEQNFWSRFKGIALLAFSDGAGKALMSVLVEEESKRMFESDPLRVLEKEILMEVGNILVGACIGKVSDLLGDVISYSPPRVLTGDLAKKANASRKMFGPGNIVIVLQTVFHFGKQDVRGYMFLIVSQESVGFLKQALKNFMERYS
ncbi:MAG: chemotaxis protein CheC [Thermodesulfobacteriota bacterium]